MLGERSRALEEQIAAAIPDLAGPLQGSGLTFEQAAAESVRLLRETGRSVRRPVLVSADGMRSATPAFILREGDALVIRDVRLAHRPGSRRDNRVRVAVNGKDELALEDAKGTPVAGGIGLWVGMGTEGYFSNLRMTPQ